MVSLLLAPMLLLFFYSPVQAGYSRTKMMNARAAPAPCRRSCLCSGHRWNWRLLSPAIYVQAHLEPCALQARLACPQQLDQYPEHPSRIFCDIFRQACSDRRLSHRDVLPTLAARFVPIRFSSVVLESLKRLTNPRVGRLSNAPFQRLAFMALVVGSNLWVQTT